MKSSNKKQRHTFWELINLLLLRDYWILLKLYTLRSLSQCAGVFSIRTKWSINACVRIFNVFFFISKATTISKNKYCIFIDDIYIIIASGIEAKMYEFIPYIFWSNWQSHGVIDALKFNVVITTWAQINIFLRQEGQRGRREMKLRVEIKKTLNIRTHAFIDHFLLNLNPLHIKIGSAACRF
jgi:hypothetical protein